MKKTLIAILTGLACCYGAQSTGQERYYSPHNVIHSPPSALMDMTANLCQEEVSPLKDLDQMTGEYNKIEHPYLEIKTLKNLEQKFPNAQRVLLITHPVTHETIQFIDFGGYYEIEYRNQFYGMSFKDEVANNQIIGYQMELYIKFLPGLNHFTAQGARRDTRPEWIHMYKKIFTFDGAEDVPEKEIHRTQINPLITDIVDEAVDNVFANTRRLLDEAYINFNSF